jgi:hypothetical protein
MQQTTHNLPQPTAVPQATVFGTAATYIAAKQCHRRLSSSPTRALPCHSLQRPHAINRLQDVALVAISEELDEIRQRFRAAAKDAHHDLMTSHAQAPRRHTRACC